MRRPGHGRWFTAYLIATAVLCGALVMVIEVLGSRVMGPFFGVSLFVWTSLITVTLAALAAGYAIGGRLADRFSSPDALYLLVLAAGALTLPIPVLRPLVLEAVLPLGLRFGALASATLLFGPALFLLGCVSPFLVRIAVREMQHLGKTVGAFYAASTLGSIMGTALTGFFLIPMLGVGRIFVVSGTLLIVLAVFYFVAVRRVWWAAAGLLLPLAITPPKVLPNAVMPDGTRVSVVHSQDSFYGNLKAVDYSQGGTHMRELVIDGLVQGGMDLATGQSVYEYAYLLEWLPYAMHPAGRNCLVIGLGAGMVPRWYQARGVATDVVDIDPAVVEVAREFFGFDGAAHVFVADARAFLRAGSKRYDYVIVDVFTGDTTPAHLLSVEAVRLIKSRQSERGILALNLMGSLATHTFMTASVVKTLEAVYANVVIYPAYRMDAGDGAGNLVVIAYDGEPIALDVQALTAYPVHPLAAELTRHAIAHPFRFGMETPAVILTDDYNPIDVYDLWLKERVRKHILDSTHHRILLGYHYRPPGAARSSG